MFVVASSLVIAVFFSAYVVPCTCITPNVVQVRIMQRPYSEAAAPFSPGHAGAVQDPAPSSAAAVRQWEFDGLEVILSLRVEVDGQLGGNGGPEYLPQAAR